MSNDEKTLKKRFGNDNPFRVPEGYFEQFNSQIMQQLPQREARIIKMQPTLWHRLRPVMLAAACVCGLFFTYGVYHQLQKNTPSADMMAQTQYYESTGYYDFDEAADYMMIDNEDIYAYVSGY